VAAAVVTLAVVVVMAAHHVGIIGQPAGDQVLHRLIRVSGAAAVEDHPGLRQGGPGPAANAAADQGVDVHLGQKVRQSPVAGAIGGHYRAADHLPVLHVVDLELLRVTEMLIDLTVFVSYRDPHVTRPPVASFSGAAGGGLLRAAGAVVPSDVRHRSGLAYHG